MLERARPFGSPDPLPAVAVLDRNDFPFGQEHIADAHRGAEQPARIEPQVQNQCPETRVLGQLGKHLAQVPGGFRPEGRQADVGDAVFRVDEVFPAVLVVPPHPKHRLQTNDFPRDGNRHRLALARVQHFERNRRTRRAFHQPDGIVQAHPSDGFAFDLHDLVPGNHSCPIRRGANDGADDLQMPVFHRHLDAHAAELALQLGAEAVDFLRRDVVGIRVQLLQHALNGRFQQLFTVHRGDVVAFHLVDHVGQGAEQLVILFVLGVPGRRFGSRGFLCRGGLFRSGGFYGRKKQKHHGRNQSQTHPSDAPHRLYPPTGAARNPAESTPAKHLDKRTARKAKRFRHCRL